MDCFKTLLINKENDLSVRFVKHLNIPEMMQRLNEDKKTSSSPSFGVDGNPINYQHPRLVHTN